MKPILHVIVVGFHHKKGCQVEYVYPPFESIDECNSNECPTGWKYLPTLALPDGSHNFDKDTVYFNLPSITDPSITVFGISCFRQIPVEKLKNRTADITRGSVQKSVCVLSRVPLYGHIQVKMELITHAYFEEGDFTKVSLLEDTYHHLNDCLEQIDNLSHAPQLYVGLCARDLLLKLRHKALLLYKLLLLEKRVIFFHSPVLPLCSTLLTLLSLHPFLLEKGLKQSATLKPSRSMSPIPIAEQDQINVNIEEHYDIRSDDSHCNGNVSCNNKVSRENSSADMALIGNKISRDTSLMDITLTPGCTINNFPDNDNDLPRDASIVDLMMNESAQNLIKIFLDVEPEKCSLPLDIFTDGYLCLPYLSLPYMDVLSDSNVTGYVIGATNVLFKQKKQLIDVLFEVDTCRLEVSDPELRRILHLSTEDLRFAEFLVRSVEGGMMEGIGWEGGDEWVRQQFAAYTFSLLRTSLLTESCKELDSFNRFFMTAWKNTSSYKKWRAQINEESLIAVRPGHPFSGHPLSVHDVKLRLSHTMQNSESGRKLNQAMISTSKAVATTGRAVGGALSQAKGAFTNWWSSITTPPPLASNTETDLKVDESTEVTETTEV